MMKMTRRLPATERFEATIGKTRNRAAETARDRELLLRETWPRLEAVIGRCN
jgi:hypothetical protein